MQAKSRKRVSPLVSRIEAKRLELGLNRAALARKLDIKYQTLNDFYYGRSQELSGNDHMKVLQLIGEAPTSTINDELIIKCGQWANEALEQERKKMTDDQFLVFVLELYKIAVEQKLGGGSAMPFSATVIDLAKYKAKGVNHEQGNRGANKTKGG